MQSTKSRPSPLLLKYSGISLVVLCLLGVLIERLFGFEFLGIAVISFIAALTTLRISSQQRFVLILSIMMIALTAAQSRGDILLSGIAVLLAAVVSIVMDGWDAGAVKILPGLAAYITISGTEASTSTIAWVVVIAALVAVALIHAIHAPVEPRPVALPQHMTAYTLLLLLSFSFTILSLYNGWPYGYWMVIALCSALQPGLVKTRSYIAGQIIEAILGVSLAVWLVWLLSGNILLIIALPVLFVAIYASLATMYRTTGAATAAAMILLFSQSSTDVSAGAATTQFSFVALSLMIIGLAVWGAWRLDGPPATV